MYILEPVVHETIWGGKRLKEIFPTDIKRIGHLYLVNGHENMSNKVKNGLYRGKTLKELFDIKKDEWELSEFEEFPLTIALVDAEENLSIQVHPDDMTAMQLENKKCGKTESWLFLEKPVLGWIYDGCICKTNKEIEEIIHYGDIDKIVNKLSIKKNDYVCIEAGTLHAMTKGSFVYEIEYGSDFTYRFYDYNRKDQNGNRRELHIDKALKAIKNDLRPKIQPSTEYRWIKEKYYEICRAIDLNTYKNTGNEIECVTVLKGRGNIDNNEITDGMSILLFPKEKLEGIELEDIIIARICR